MFHGVMQRFVDELHTFDGAQKSDLALLLRCLCLRSRH
jgi:ATP-dependent helicase YprA (DUF1998 family)